VTCASAHAPVHSERGRGGTNRAGPRQREREREREERGARGNGSATGDPGPRDREREREKERESAREKNWRRQISPTGQRAREGGRARGRTAADRRGPLVRRRGRVAWLGRLGPARLLYPFLFL
jgi:hypothetical protein